MVQRSTLTNGLDKSAPLRQATDLCSTLLHTCFTCGAEVFRRPFPGGRRQPLHATGWGWIRAGPRIRTGAWNGCRPACHRRGNGGRVPGLPAGPREAGEAPGSGRGSGGEQGGGRRPTSRVRPPRRATPHVAGDAPRRGRGPGGRQAPRSGLPRLEAGDAAVVVDGEAPAGAHLAPGVVAVADDETATAVDLLLDVHVAVGGEDLAVGPVGEVPLGTVVGHRRALGEHGREGLAVMVVDSRDEGADGRVAESRGLNRHASQRGPEPDAPPPTPPERRPPRFGPAARVRRWTGDEPLPRDRRETT